MLDPPPELGEPALGGGVLLLLLMVGVDDEVGVLLVAAKRVTTTCKEYANAVTGKHFIAQCTILYIYIYRQKQYWGKMPYIINISTEEA